MMTTFRTATWRWHPPERQTTRDNSIEEHDVIAASVHRWQTEHERTEPTLNLVEILSSSRLQAKAVWDALLTASPAASPMTRAPVGRAAR
jgi:hypothetical protein